ncbi:hypothetical protein [Streptomyces sp. IB2014 016-6]|uniref:hypothetical protein n=1 Tax=Streptomyces sp. IB2014 016-6 TaxID=2517818 RepID=UPI00164EF708|nr:hypothetical protein [Streptomyces sp. IB2014 016-6]
MRFCGRCDEPISPGQGERLRIEQDTGSGTVWLHRHPCVKKLTGRTHSLPRH